jgi:Transcriptional Coactivator p15 (PC4).
VKYLEDMKNCILLWQGGPPPKKAKANTSSSKADEEPSWLLDRNRFVKVHEFKGNVYVDIREFYESDGELKPSRKGGCAKKILDVMCV